MFVIIILVIFIWELKDVDILSFGWKFFLYDVKVMLVSGIDLCVIIFVCVVECMFVNFFGFGVMNDVGYIEIVVLIFELGIELECFGLN